MREPNVGHAQILLVEDAETDALIVRQVLEARNRVDRIHLVRDGDEALRFIRREGEYAEAPVVDLVVLDLNLPGTSGLDVLAGIRAQTELNKVPVIILTSSRSEEDIARSYDAGANCYVSKPLDYRGFRDVLATLDEFWLKVATLPGPRRT